MALSAPMTTARPRLLALGLGLLLLAAPSRGAVPCNGADAAVCEARLWEGSTCVAGGCTNPLRSGCLRALLGSDRYAAPGDETSAELAALRDRLLATPRACNSEDGAAEVEDGVCARHNNDYPEVRVWAQNWESGYVLAWIMQIVYSELLDVPSTIETGVKGKSLNFYDAENSMGVGSSNQYAMFQNAHKATGGDCGVYREGNAAAAADDYVPCAHLVMDVWSSNNELEQALADGAAEPMQYTGMVAFNGWHVTRFSVERDPSLANYFGLGGEANREKLAETFKRPTTWGTYCQNVSTTNCTVADGVAARAPAEDEAGKYFSAGAYTGHFRKTAKNDCCEGQCNCTGHFMDYPCGWTSYVKQQTEHLDIALESDGGDATGGYTYGEMVDIWNAANATKSDLIGIWWTPDATVTKLSGSGSDLTRVVLPPVTQECVENRIDPAMRCELEATDFDIYGDEEGACGEEDMFTKKGAVGSMQKNIQDNPSLKARMSPAYEAYKEFSITKLEVDKILSDWVDRDLDRDNFDLRFTTCQWVADNLEVIVEKLVPESYPRSFVETSKNYYRNGMTIVALVISMIAISTVMGVTAGILYRHKQGTLGRGAQINFMVLILVGLFLVSIGSLLLALEPSKGSCVGYLWMINLGYTMQLVPVLTCVSTIIKLIRAASKMKMVQVDMKKLVYKTIAVIGLAFVFSALWTALDAPDSAMDLHLTEEVTDLGETKVSVTHYCTGDSQLWPVLYFLFHGLLLVCATALAFQMRSVPSAINNSREIATLVYSSVIFLVLRILLYYLGQSLPDGALQKDTIQKGISMLLSIDTIANIVIYFVRYLTPKEEPEEDNSRWTSKYQSNVQSCRQSSISSFEGKPQANKLVKFASGSEEGKNSLSSKDLPKSGDNKQVGGPAKSEFSVEEEKEEEASPIIRYKMKNKSITLPKWVVEKYGETHVYNEQEQTIASTLDLSEDICSKDQGDTQ